MEQQKFAYTVVTPKGDHDLVTTKPHSHYRSVEDFIRDNQAKIDLAFKVGNFSIQVIQVYLQHGRRGQRIK